MAMGPNVLVSCAGRRVGLLRAFQEAVAQVGGRVLATDLNPELSAACQLADEALAVPPLQDPAFLATVLDVAVRNDVGVVVPTLDTELALYASVADDWAQRGITVCVPTPELVTICRDKRLTAKLFSDLGISPLEEVADSYPRFVKPISGSLSKDIHVVRSPEDMLPGLDDRSRYVHQELIDHEVYTEFTVDALFSRTGELVCAVPRRRIEVRGGEIAKGRTQKGPLLDVLRSKFAQVPGARGCLTIQLFCNLDDALRPLVGIEVNGRFGGGYPMSDAAGAKYAQWIVDEAIGGQQLTYRDDWQGDLTFLRYDEQVAVAP